jgi:hypothetical protein
MGEVPSYAICRKTFNVKGGLIMEGSMPVFIDFVAHAGMYAIGFISVYLLGVYYC